MKITVRSNKVIVDGYVNAVDRFSRPLPPQMGAGMVARFVEKILPNVFKKAIARARNIEVLLNHNPDRKLADTVSGTAKIIEDNVGLRATVEITDPEVIEKARAGKLRGWSFGFSDEDAEQTTRADGLIERVINKLNLHEVSIIDDRALPAYIGTSIETRSIDGTDVSIRVSDDTEIDTETDTTESVGDDGKTSTDRGTDETDQTEGDDAEDEQAKAELETQRLQREADIRDVSI